MDSAESGNSCVLDSKQKSCSRYFGSNIEIFILLCMVVYYCEKYLLGIIKFHQETDRE